VNVKCKRGTAFCGSPPPTPLAHTPHTHIHNSLPNVIEYKRYGVPDGGEDTNSHTLTDAKTYIPHTCKTQRHGCKNTRPSHMQAIPSHPPWPWRGCAARGRGGCAPRALRPPCRLPRTTPSGETACCLCQGRLPAVSVRGDCLLSLSGETACCLCQGRLPAVSVRGDCLLSLSGETACCLCQGRLPPGNQGRLRVSASVLKRLQHNPQIYFVAFCYYSV
jgi:hypothetical protein